MSVIERVMKAYASKHDLKPQQVALVRAELSSFIGELMSGKRPEIARVSATQDSAFTGRLDADAVTESPSEQRMTGH
jgi:hypothetical protein